MEKDIQGSQKFWAETFWFRLGGAELYLSLIVFLSLVVPPWQAVFGSIPFYVSLLSIKAWALGIALMLCQGLQLPATFCILKVHRQAAPRFSNVLYKPIDHAIRSVLLLFNPFQGPLQLLHSLLFITSSLLTGSFFLWVYLYFLGAPNAGKLGGLSWGAMLGLTYAGFVFFLKEDVLTSPIISRKRIFAVKQECPTAAVHAFWTTVGALVAGSLASMVTGLPRWPSSVASALCLFVGLWTCSFCCWAGLKVLKVVFTERLRFLTPGGSGDPTSLLFGALNSKNELIRQAALVDLCQIAESSGPDVARRAPIFADESGAAWAAATSFCLDEVSQLVTTVAAALPGPGPEASKATAPTPRWNALPLALQGGNGAGAQVKPTVGKPQDDAAWMLEARNQRLALCLRALSGITAASRAEDRFGVVQLGEPNLATVVGALASALLVLQRYLPHSAPLSRRRCRWFVTWLPMWLRNFCLRFCWLPSFWLAGTVNTTGAPNDKRVNEAAYALTDVALVSMYRVATAFRDSLLVELGKVSAPLYGTRAELVSLVSGMLDYLQ